MQVELTKKASIALEHLPPPDRQRVGRALELLEGFPNSVTLRGKYHKLGSTHEPNLYVARAGEKFRAIFRKEGAKLVVLDILPHDRLNLFFKAFGGSR